MTTVLTVRVPNIGTERYALSLYDADGGGHQEWLASELTLTTFVNLVVEWSQGADFVCVDMRGMGVVLADLLEDRHIGVLCMRRGRPLNRVAGAEPPQARVRGAAGDVQWEGVMDRAKLESTIRGASAYYIHSASGLLSFDLKTLIEAAGAHLAALPKTKMAEVWHVEHCERGEPYVMVVGDAVIAQAKALAFSKMSDVSCIRVTGPHQQEVPA